MYGRDLALRRAQEKFREVLARAGDHPPVLDRIDSENYLVNDTVAFCARFSAANGGVFYAEWHLDRYELEELPGSLGAGRNWLIGEYRSLYSRMYEDHLLELELRPRRQVLDELVRLNADPSVLQIAHREYAEFARHLHRHHRNERMYFPGSSHLDRTRRRSEPVRLTTNNTVASIPAGPSPTTMEMMTLIEEARQNISREFYNFARADFRGLYGESGEVGTEAAQAKGLELLKSWLTPEQAAQYEKYKHFEVVGSATKKRYRIRHGRQINVDELSANGDVVRKLCALPEGGLVAADVMLGQKIMLETDERKFLAKANVFGDTTRLNSNVVVE